MNTYTDDRGFRIFDLFNLPQGQINVQRFYNPKLIVGWHSHIFEETYICLQGAFKIGIKEVYDEQKGIYHIEWKYLSEHEPTKTVIIKPNLWHGFRCLLSNSILLYHMSEKYDSSKIKSKPINNEDIWLR